MPEAMSLYSYNTKVNRMKPSTDETKWENTTATMYTVIN